MKEPLSETIKKAASSPANNPDFVIFHRIPKFAMPVMLNPAGPNAYASGQDRRRQRRERERHNGR